LKGLTIIRVQLKFGISTRP